MHSRWSLVLILSLSGLALGLGCSKVTSAPEDYDADEDAAGTGSSTNAGVGGRSVASVGGATSSGGRATSSGGSTSASSGGSTSTSSGGSDPESSGGMSMGGASSSGGASAALGDCMDVVPLSDFDGVTGDVAVYTCRVDRDSCAGVTLNEPALFECISSHPPNCHVQQPEGSGSTWQFVALCVDTAMGGAAGSSGM
jgi:hypothetical protein